MEKETSLVSRQFEQLKEEKIRLIKKIGDLSANVSRQTDEMEEKNKEKAILSDELVRYRQEIQDLEVGIEDLRKKLDQRLNCLSVESLYDFANNYATSFAISRVPLSSI